jgi:phospholipid/cholesterol/gamma-HCH transport system permease protein
MPYSHLVASQQRPLLHQPSQKEPNSYHVARNGDIVRIAGDLRIRDAADIWRYLHKQTADAAGNIVFEVSDVRGSDSSVIALLVELRAELAARGLTSEIAGANERVETIVNLYSGHGKVAAYQRSKAEGLVAQIGRASFEVKEEVQALLDFLGSIVVTGIALVRHPRTGHWKDVAPLCEKTGADAVPIVLLINFLVGFVMAFQSAKQLKLFGANIYVADLVGISHTREIAPLMTSIIVCGRSGAAFAAELGSMKVNEEIDALRSLGISPFGWLVVPRMVALMLVVPILILLADVVGLAGGLIVGALNLGISPRGYVIETMTAVHGSDVLTGLVKGIIFSIAIAVIACQQGFAASGGAEGVGKRTTASVVTSLFALVVLDAILTVIFRAIDL